MSCWLNGVGLEEIDPCVKVKGVTIGATETRVQCTDYAKYSGARFLGIGQGVRTIVVTFKVLHPDACQRERIVSEIRSRFEKGRLEVAQRPGQYIDVWCTQYPSLELTREYAQKDITLAFTAFDPDFKDVRPTALRVRTQAAVWAEANLMPPGTGDVAFLEFEVTNLAASDMNNAALRVNGREFAFSRLGLGAGKSLRVTRDEYGRQKMVANGVSALDKRSGDDELLLKQRTPNRIAVYTQCACNVALWTRGQYP